MKHRLTESSEEEVTRVRLPEGKQVLGIVVELLGASRFRVECKDGHERICRIPGKFRRRVGIRVGDIVLVEPWDVQSEERGDIIWIYNKTHANWLRNKGFI